MKHEEIKKILVFRFSAMGDVAMTVPVITLLARQHPELRITLLTRFRFVPLFTWTPANVEVQGINLDNYSGVSGLTRLYRELSQKDFDAVADLHDVLRTKYLRNLFRLQGTKVAVVNKERKQKRALIGHGQTAIPLRPMYERYADVFRQLGFELETQEPTNVQTQKLFNFASDDFIPIHAFAGKKQPGEKWIGVAPFAAHPMKIYPLDSMRLVCDLLLEHGYKIFLFGAGREEAEELDSWQCDNMRSVCGQLGSLQNEMLLISQLDLMISMDSANMHIAALLGTPTLSIWGATHPSAGFMPWSQDSRNILQVPDLPCRPCSIYGNKPCHLGDHRCMTYITPQQIADQAQRLLHTE